jgi:hypothetical protein
MAFEVIVRPAVVPNIRPTPSQSVPAAANDPNKGIFTIHGTSGKFIELPYSWSASTSESRSRETKRKVDRARVYQKADDGTVNKDNFVDVEVAKKIWMKNGSEDAVYTYQQVVEADNIEIKERDIIKRIDTT